MLRFSVWVVLVLLVTGLPALVVQTQFARAGYEMQLWRTPLWRRMMNYGFGHSLGVRCQHCHVLGHWSEEDKNTKQIARDMMAMTGRINNELLPAIKNIKSEHAGVNCGTCHHGIARPGFGPMQAMQQPPPPGAPPPGAKH